MDETFPISVRPTQNLRHQNICFLFLVAATGAWFWQELGSVFALSLHEERGRYSHILLIPLICGYILYTHRKIILATAEWNFRLGLLLMGLGVAASLSVVIPTTEALDALSWQILCLVIILWGAFLLCHGVQAFRSAFFGLGLLVFMVPLPSFLLDAIIEFLQHSSAEASAVLFSVLDIPVFREGLMFSLSNFTIHVAEECSGIRSALSLFITSLIAGHLFLRSGWGKMGLVLIVVPLAIVKNALRIVGLALLANYVDPTFITDSALHRNGGIPLFLLSLMVLFSFVWLFRRFEKQFGLYPSDGWRAKV